MKDEDGAESEPELSADERDGPDGIRETTTGEGVVFITFGHRLTKLPVIKLLMYVILTGLGKENWLHL